MLKTLNDFIKNLLANLFIEGDVNYITGNETLPPPLTKEEEVDLVTKFKDEGLIEARNKLIEHNLRLVVYIAKKYDTNIANLEDLISIGTLGLVKAVATFKLDKNIKLATYASRCIENEILMFLRKKSRTKFEVSLDEPLKIDYDGNELLLSDVLSNNENLIINEIDENEQRKVIYDSIDNLKPREREIMNMRFGLNNIEEKTQKEVADLLGISQSYISRIEKKIIKKLRQNLNKK